MPGIASRCTLAEDPENLVGGRTRCYNDRPKSRRHYAYTLGLHESQFEACTFKHQDSSQLFSVRLSAIHDKPPTVSLPPYHNISSSISTHGTKGTYETEDHRFLPRPPTRTQGQDLRTYPPSSPNRLYHKWHQAPLTLRVCHASRDIALKHFTACEAIPRPSYIDFNVDTIIWESIRPFAHFEYIFPETDNWPNIPTWDLGLVTGILVELDAWKGGRNRERIVFEQIAPTIATNGRHSIDTLDGMVIDALKLCPNLKEIVIEVYCRPDDEANFRWRP